MPRLTKHQQVPPKSRPQGTLRYAQLELVIDHFIHSANAGHSFSDCLLNMLLAMTNGCGRSHAAASEHQHAVLLRP
jgi:hypothetical protein